MLVRGEVLPAREQMWKRRCKSRPAAHARNALRAERTSFPRPETPLGLRPRCVSGRRPPSPHPGTVTLRHTPKPLPAAGTILLRRSVCFLSAVDKQMLAPDDEHRLPASRHPPQPHLAVGVVAQPIEGIDVSPQPESVAQPLRAGLWPLDAGSAHQARDVARRGRAGERPPSANTNVPRPVFLPPTKSPS